MGKFPATIRNWCHSDIIWQKSKVCPRLCRSIQVFTQKLRTTNP